MTMEKAINLYQALDKLLVKDLPIQVQFYFSKMYDSLSPDIKNYEDKRSKLLVKYGDKKDENSYQIKRSELDNWNREHMELLNAIIETPVLPRKLKLSDFGDVKVDGATIFALQEYIEE